MRFFVVLSTTPDLRSARKIARLLIQKKLAACVSFSGGWISVFRWKKRLTTASEALLLVKTTSVKLKALQKVILRVHPYEVPEILVLQVSSGSPDYLNWAVKPLLLSGRA